MKITIDPFDKNSIESAIAQVRQYERDLKVKEELFVQRLAEIGVTVATEGFANAQYDGDSDVSVRLTKIPNGYAVDARGETVGFIEFGTGVRFPEWNNFGVSYTPPPRGSYGRGYGKNPKGWFYAPGKHSYGNPPAQAMLTARDEMVGRVMQIAREVFG